VVEHMTSPRSDTLTRVFQHRVSQPAIDAESDDRGYHSDMSINWTKRCSLMESLH